MTDLGLLDAFNQWKNTRYENHLSVMKEQNKCPDCYGRGFYTFSANEFFYHAAPYDCPGCNGSGRYSDWEEYR